jgi:hypothetical protein
VGGLLFFFFFFFFFFLFLFLFSFCLFFLLLFLLLRLRVLRSKHSVSGSFASQPARVSVSESWLRRFLAATPGHGPLPCRVATST